MTSGKWFRMVTMVLAALAVCAVPRAIRAQDQPAAPVQPAPGAPQVGARRDLDQLSAILRDPQSSAEQRDEAARRLVSRQSPEARQILADSLVDVSNPAGQLSAARAVADDPNPDPALVNPLFALLGNGGRQLTEAAARALANYKSNSDVLSRLIGIIQRRPPAAEFVREKILRAIGSTIEKRVAQCLVEVLQAPDESLTIRNAAADALTDMTGISDYDRDVGQWTAWWTANAAKTDQQFRNDLLPRRSQGYDQVRQRYNQLTAELEQILSQQYESAPAAQRPDMLMRYLKSAAPEVRAAAAGIINNEVLANNTIPSPIREQLRMMIGDSSPQVRGAVADALANINDAGALDPLLAQLTQETDSSVRARLAKALAPINDPRAVPALMGLLDDQSYAVARAAADAIRQLGPKVRDDSALASRAALALRDAFEKRSATPDASDVRAAMIGAVVPLRREELLPFLNGLLEERRGESADIRRLALTALGEIRNPQSAAVAASALDDRDATVRSAAVHALGNMPNAAEYAETLRRRVDPNIEFDPSIRDDAWTVLETIFLSLSKEQLKSLSEHFKDQPGRYLVIEKDLAAILVKQNAQDELATERQTIADTLMTLEDYKEAAEYFRLALDYEKSKVPPAPQAEIERLLEGRMKAMLLSKQYPEAIAFASQSISENPANKQTMGVLIRSEVDRLQSAATPDLDNALKLVQEAKTMKPPLAQQDQDQISELENQIRKRLSERGDPGTTPLAPLNASLESQTNTR